MEVILEVTLAARSQGQVFELNVEIKLSLLIVNFSPLVTDDRDLDQTVNLNRLRLVRRVLNEA